MKKRGGRIDELVDEYGVPALHTAAANGDIEIVRYLVGRGASPNSEPFRGRGGTALHYAMTKKRNTEVIEFLLENGADINARNSVKQTVLIRAIEIRNTEGVRLLLKKGVATDKVCRGRTPVEYAENEGQTDSCNAIKCREAYDKGVGCLKTDQSAAWSNLKLAKKYEPKFFEELVLEVLRPSVDANILKELCVQDFVLDASNPELINLILGNDSIQNKDEIRNKIVRNLARKYLTKNAMQDKEFLFLAKTVISELEVIKFYIEYKSMNALWDLGRGTTTKITVIGDSYYAPAGYCEMYRKLQQLDENALCHGNSELEHEIHKIASQRKSTDAGFIFFGWRAPSRKVSYAFICDFLSSKEPTENQHNNSQPCTQTTANSYGF